MRIFYEFFSFFSSIIRQRHLLWQLTKRDLVSRYIGTLFGFAWLIIRPAIFVSVIWFVFSVGLRGGGNQLEVPFIVYLVVGYSAWFYFTDCLNSGTGVIKSYSYLINKMNVRLAVLPLVKIFSGGLVHLIFLGLVIPILVFNGFTPNWYWLQLIYYYFCVLILLLGLTWFTSSVNLFFPDMGQIVSVFIQLGFWMTPIFWNMERLPPAAQEILKFNPMYYIVTGYRDSLIFRIGIWERPNAALYYWTVTLLVLAVGVYVFRKTRPHFADVVG